MSINTSSVSSNGQVGIITLGGNFNYGNRLQAYATCKIYSDLGFDPVLLLIEKRSQPFSGVKAVIKQILHMKTDDPEALMSEERSDAFRRFNTMMSTKVVPDTKDSVFDKLRFVSVGSDQVWNPLFIKHYEDWFMVDFLTEERKIALSPSIGLEELDAKQAKRLASSLRTYNKVSVRERRGAELIRQCSGIEAEVICDPTLVISPDEWRSVADGRCTPAQPYVFTYLLGGVGTEASEVLEEVTDHGRIPIISLTDRQKDGEPDAGPSEFIDLIDHAEHVVTDSFHAAVFSSILETSLTIVHREGGASMFSRLEQLSQMLGIEEKVYGSDTFDFARASEYEGVPEAIDRERAHFMGFLKGCLDG